MFYPIMTTGVVYGFVFTSFIITIVDHVRDVAAVTSTEASLLVTVMAFGDLISRLSAGYITDKGFISREQLIAICYVLISVCYLLLAWIKTIPQFAAVAFAFGLNNGGITIIMPVLLADHLGNQYLPVTYGLHRLTMAVSTLTRPYLIGAW